MAVASRRRGRQWAGLGHRVAATGRCRALAVAGWRALKEKLRCPFHSLHRALSLSTALSLSRTAGAPSAAASPRYSVVA